jgi:hypothetical protein
MEEMRVERKSRKTAGNREGNDAVQNERRKLKKRFPPHPPILSGFRIGVVCLVLFAANSIDRVPGNLAGALTLSNLEATASTTTTNGAGGCNSGTLTMTDLEMSGNTATGNDGGIPNAGEGS